MAKRITNQSGGVLNFTCDNSQYQTNVTKGKKHYPNQNHKGCVTKVFDDGYSALFLEHVLDKKKPTNEIFWLMWYFPDGRPCIGESAVFGKADLKKMIQNVTTLKL